MKKYIFVFLLISFNLNSSDILSSFNEIFRLIYTKASVDICSKRDVKGLYAKAKSGDIKSFTGISSPYEEPQKPDLVINTAKEQVHESIERLYNFIKKEFSFS